MVLCDIAWMVIIQFHIKSVEIDNIISVQQFISRKYPSTYNYHIYNMYFYAHTKLMNVSFV